MTKNVKYGPGATSLNMSGETRTALFFLRAKYPYTPRGHLISEAIRRMATREGWDGETAPDVPFDRTRSPQVRMGA